MPGLRNMSIHPEVSAGELQLPIPLVQLGSAAHQKWQAEYQMIVCIGFPFTTEK